ncbi:MAG TPA: sugar phosphate isomerase/epimerase family protein [Planctomycetota bacterium]|jgi:sugar phosphate isomerase/epimerase
MAKLKIGVALWSLGQTRDFAAFERSLDKAASLGVTGVQPWCVDEPKWDLVCALDPDRCTTALQRREVRRACEKRGRTISAFCAQLAGPKTLGGFGETDANLGARLAKTRRALQMAAEIGSPIVTTHIGPIPENPNDAEYARFIDSVRSVMKDAEKSGGIFALETGQESAQCLKQFIDNVGSPNLKVNFDPANMIHRDPVGSVAVLAKYIVHTHAKDKHPETGKPTVGKGSVPWKEYLAALEAINYQGWFALEDESCDENVAESIRFGREFLEQV